MASTMTAIQTVTVGAGGQASITFSSIPQTFTDLQLVISGRSSDASAVVSSLITINGSSANVSSLYMYGNPPGGNAVSGLNGYPTGVINASTSTANTFSNSYIYFPNYSSTTANKSYSVDSVMENNSISGFPFFVAGLNSSTAAINAINISPGAGSFVQYTTATLYGVYNSALEATPSAPTIGTATAASTGANVAFTPAGSGAPAASYIATSSPGGITATGATSPILVTGLTSGTAYTFTVAGQNPGGTGASSAASNSVTPYDGYESIATLYGTGSSNTVSFTSIPSTYQHLQLRIMVRGTDASATAYSQMRFNNDSANNYSFHYLTGNGSTAGASGTSSTNGSIGMNMPAATATSGLFAVGVYDILDYVNTNKNKTVRLSAGHDRNGSGEVFLSSGAWYSTTAINRLDFIVNAGNLATGSVFELYGIR